MTALVVALAATCVVLGLLLVCALVGASQQADDLLARLGYRDARIEDLENELRSHQRRNHPAGRGLRAAPPPYHDVPSALQEALTERYPVSDTPTFDALATERHLAEVRRLPTRGDGA